MGYLPGPKSRAVFKVLKPPSPRGQVSNLETTGLCRLGQWSPTFLAPGTGYVEGSFPTDWGGGGMALG